MAKVKLKVKNKDIVIVDIKKVLNKYKEKQQLKKFFDVIPMNKILEKVMSISYYIDYSDTVFDVLEESNIDLEKYDIDVDLFFILLECILVDIDNIILDIVNIPDEMYYIYIKNLDEGSIVLEFLR